MQILKKEVFVREKNLVLKDVEVTESLTIHHLVQHYCMLFMWISAYENYSMILTAFDMLYLWANNEIYICCCKQFKLN